MNEPRRERPTVRQIELKCIHCGNIVTHYMTNIEIFSDTQTKQHCSKCDEVTDYKLRRWDE